MQNAKIRHLRAHHRTILSGYVFATKAYIDNRKKLLNSNISSICPRNIVNFRPLTAVIGSAVWDTPENFNGFRLLASLLHRHLSTEVNQTLHDVWPSPGLVHYVYIFGGCYPLTEFCQVQHSHCVQVLRSPISAALLHDIRSVCVRQTLRRVTRKGTRELSLLFAPPTFGGAAVTLGIGPHSSYLFCPPN